MRRGAVAPFADAYNPRQPRGPDGRWVSSGGGISLAISAVGSSEPVHSVFASVRRPGEIGKLVGHDVRGFKHAISNERIRHVLREHGDAAKEIARGQKPVTLADFQKVPAIVRRGKFVEAEQRPFGPRRFKIVADIDGDKFEYVVEARRGKRRLDLITMWKR